MEYKVTRTLYKISFTLSRRNSKSKTIEEMAFLQNFLDFTHTPFHTFTA
jgi:hypothetical protein